MKTTKNFIALALSLAMVCSFSTTAFAQEANMPNYDEETTKMYEELYAEDQAVIAEIERNLPAMLEEGRIAAENDVKSDLPETRSSALGTYGDILVSLMIDSGSVGFAGHAAIVSSNSAKTIESYAKNWSPIDKDGVQYYDNTWNTKSGALLVRPNGASSSQYSTAAAFAAKQVGKPYNWVFTNKTTTEKFYCSQLVWQAWLDAGINCETGSIPNAIIAPADLVNSSNTYIVKKVQ
ncbi:hypothetical protein C806_02841 [Lachnospiraceae bacterium 3-1]|jgi:uncharacterized protein YycO|uniref:YiiX/YebB-like N1pC/P60 family cysteine hydrolase n=1 Tax=Eubacterium sp. 14-2 TaxID=1235790 RepID=UPI0003410E25|nr:YiiX/YebB-like N1pC/P60 family cysteine hydrolase [Eubacterium sp. 14-2]EOS23336.1 hypothetical protein C806_02841 [Lachnospiraceae bacterium 3-1]EOT26977.1 hypothetical protein C805_01080 [Eubacterium sp. 14-2]MCX4379466.1 YiiX/YebB-like N1pC/P60 family cysteine hydrolase [Lachnospiraceae bacterium]